MKIVVIEGYTVNPGDLSWQSIAVFGELVVHERTPEQLIVERCKHADIILSNKLPFTKETVLALPNAKLICVLATGYNVIDIKTAREKISLFAMCLLMELLLLHNTRLLYYSNLLTMLVFMQNLLQTRFLALLVLETLVSGLHVLQMRLA